MTRLTRPLAAMRLYLWTKPVTALRRGLTSTDWLIRAVVLASLALIVLAAITLWVSASGRAGVRAIDRNAEASNCKSNLNAQVVLAKAEVDDVILDGLIAAAVGDDEEMLEVVARIAPVRKQRDAAVHAYDEGTALAESDPEAFLEACRKRTG